MGRKKIDDPQEDGLPTFEDALAGLETIVEAMENENLPLEELVAHYEKGSGYLARCEAILQVAKGRIQLITLRNQNPTTFEEDEPAAEDTEFSGSQITSDELDDDNDIRLF